MQRQPDVPEWKYKRQFGYQEGVATSEKRMPVFSPDRPKPLAAEQLRSFLANGYLVLQTELPPSFHEAMYNRFVELIGDDNDDNPGNNLLPLVPELHRVFDDPVVKGALTSVLGPGYLMHPHRVLHDNPPGSNQQVWHHDSYWGYKRKVHNHRPWWVMIMYYPQEIYERIGPTGVIPGSHCIAQRLEDIDQIGVPLSGAAGTFVMIHYDIWHRKMKNFTNLKRFMVKFEFTRMAYPERDDASSRDLVWRAPANPPAHGIEPMWQDQLRWLAGARPDAPTRIANGGMAAVVADLASGDGTRQRAAMASIHGATDALDAIPALIDLLDARSPEPISLFAAYTLGSFGKAAVPGLVEAMRGNDGESVDDARVFIDEGQHSEVEMVARNAAHALVAVGVDAVPELVRCLREGGPRVRKYAVFALGEIRSNAPEVLSVLAGACRDPDVYVRINAVEAIGLKTPTAEVVQAATDALADREDEVRFNAALALARLGKGAAAAVPALRDALCDGNRYVVGYALEALDRIGTPEAMAALIPFLKVSRWCPLTSNKSLF